MGKSLEIHVGSTSVTCPLHQLPNLIVLHNLFFNRYAKMMLHLSPKGYQTNKHPHRDYITIINTVQPSGRGPWVLRPATRALHFVLNSSNLGNCSKLLKNAAPNNHQKHHQKSANATNYPPLQSLKLQQIAYFRDIFLEHSVKLNRRAKA